MNDLQKLIASVGSVAEMCRIFYDACIAQNFTPAQALALTREIPKAVFRPQGQGGVNNAEN